ncbi:reverse transcriptase domain-containing protein [Tanacetum coccineum]
MDDEPMWAADRVVALTPGSAITIPKTAHEFAIKDTENEAVRLMMFPLTGEAKTWLNELNEGTIETWDELRTAFISRFFPSPLFGRLLGEIRAFSQNENESLTNAWLRMKEMLRNCHDLDDDDIPMSCEEEFMQTFRKTRFYNDYRDRDSNRDNWRLRGRNDYNRDNYRSNTDDKPYNLQRQFNYFMKSHQSTNAFVKETFMDLKTQLKTVTKNHQASIQNLETKFDRLADKQSGRPSRSLPSNT